MVARGTFSPTSIRYYGAERGDSFPVIWYLRHSTVVKAQVEDSV